MKLVRFSTNGQSPRLGALQGDRIADLQASVAATLSRRGVVRAQEIAATLVPASTRQFLEGGAATQERPNKNNNIHKQKKQNIKKIKKKKK